MVAGVASAIVVKLQKKIVSFYSRDLDLNTPSARSRRSSCVNGAAGLLGTDAREADVLNVLDLFLWTDREVGSSSATVGAMFL